MERRVGHMQVETGGTETGVPEQELDAAQIDARFEQMGRETVPS